MGVAPAFEVRPLLASDVAASARLHAEVLKAEFLARCGERFLQQYHKAWLAAPGSVALAAVGGGGQVLGALLGTLEPELHFRAMVRHQGPVLALLLVARALAHPRFGWELLRVRGTRYARGLLRMLYPAGWRPVSARPPARPRVGEVTHVMVSPDAQGRGIGRALLERAVCLAKGEGLDELVLVTPPEAPARGFYQHLGWRQEGQLTSRSGEAFVRYRLPLVGK